MRKTTLLWASVCLLLSGAFRPLDAAPESEDKENADGTGRPGFCFLDSEVGPCSTNIKRYFYNHHSGRCEEFVYGGCKGNLNNFETEADCQRSCGDPDDSAQPAASSTPRPAKRNAAVWGRPGFCFLDSEVGPCSTNIKRYYYNHHSGRCEEFVFGGCKGNLNNFETEADCQRSCGDPDDRAQPAASSTPRPAKRNAAVWGRPGFCFLDSEVGPCSTNIKRYFYNHHSGRCEEFVYGGCKGNLNNFETEADCQRSCGDRDDRAQPAASSTPRPAKRNAAVWGRPGFCFLDSEVGPCSTNIKRYYYNHHSGRCEEFVYGGCKGNLNNFETEADCQRSCGDPDDSAQPAASSTPRPAKRNAAVWGRPGFCFLDSEVGPCSTNIKRYFYNHHSGRCEEFVYGGCKGNLNNFETEADCQRSCGDRDDRAQPAASSTPRPAKRNAAVWGRPGFCFLDSEVGPCSTNIKRYYYNHHSGRCEEFVYGGCKGNLNNFETEADCQRSCGDPDDSAQPAASSTPRPAKRNAAVWGRPGFCFLDSEVGPCSTNIKRYFYNHHSGRCEEFVYGGCKGNLNNFETEADCQRSCGDRDDSAQPAASSTPRPAKRNAAVWGRPGFCFLDSEVGPCSTNIKRYYYNHHSGRCEEFVFGGCKGNLNNFETEADCQRSCGDPDDRAQPAASSTPRPAKRNAAVWGRPGFCFLDSEVGPCSTNIKRYFYNHRSGRCEEFVYGGCKGNLNNFETEADCQRSCGDPDDSAQPTASSTPGPAKRNSAVRAFPKRTPKGRLMKTKRRKNSVEIGYEIY